MVPPPNPKPSLLHRTKSLRSLGNIKDPTKCDECKYELPFHSRSCVSGAAKLCTQCGRDSTYNHNPAVCDVARKNQAEWTPDTEADQHAAALRKQGDLPPTPDIPSQTSLKRSPSEEEHHGRDAPGNPATIGHIPDDKDAMDADDDLYVDSNPPQLDNDEEDPDIAGEDPAIAEEVNRKSRELAAKSVNELRALINQETWTSSTPFHDDPTMMGRYMASIASTLCFWINRSNTFDDETARENYANSSLNQFQTSFKIHAPYCKNVFDNIYRSPQDIREEQISDELTSMSRSISSLVSMVSTLTEKTNKLEKQAQNPSKPKVSFSSNVSTAPKILADPLGANFTHDPRFPPPPPVIKQRVPAPKGGRTNYATAMANTRIPGSGYRMDTQGTIHAPDGYMHSEHNAPQPGLSTTIYTPPIQSVGTDKDGYTTVTYAKAAQKKPKQVPTKVTTISTDHPDGEVVTKPMNRANGSVNTRIRNVKRVYLSLPDNLAIRPLPNSIKSTVRAGLKGSSEFKHLVILNVEYTSNGNLCVSFTNIRPDFDSTFLSLSQLLNRIINISGAHVFTPSPQFKLVLPAVPVFDKHTNVLYSERDLSEELSSLPQFEGHEFLYPPRFMASIEHLNTLDYCNVSIILKDTNRLSFDHFFLHNNRSIPIFGVIRRLEEMRARPTISQCDNCHRLGHSSIKCCSVARCAICSEPHRTAVHVARCAPCTASNNLACQHFAHCINCQGDHNSRSSTCPARRNYRPPL